MFANDGEDTAEAVGIEPAAPGLRVIEVTKGGFGGPWSQAVDPTHDRRVSTRSTPMASSGPAAGDAAECGAGTATKAPPVWPAAPCVRHGRADARQAASASGRRNLRMAPPMSPNPPSISHAAAGSGTTPVS